MDTITKTANEHRTAPQSRSRPSNSLGSYASVLAIGVYLGILFIKSEVASWERVHRMFLFQEAHMYIIIGVGIAVSMVSMACIKRLGLHDIQGNVISYQPKPFHRGVAYGGMLFGAGWALTGACPGPIYAQIGAGEALAMVTLIGALCGMFSYAVMKPKLPT